ncbi:hypothetical protein LINGRAHAP2_LOCUS7037 [Linum grandiflorum]
MANPSGTHLEHRNHDSTATNSNGNGTNLANGKPERSNSGAVLKHNPGISNDWTPEEQSILEDGLSKYASESNIIRYAKIAMQVQKKEFSKRRKEDNLSRKSKDKKEKLTDASTKPSSFVARPNGPAYANTVVPIDYDDGISCKAIGGLTGDLLEQNAQALSQITSNLSTMQIQENINLLFRTRDNILKIMNNLNDVPEVMKQMPPLPVKLNEELANAILPRTSIPMK